MQPEICSTVLIGLVLLACASPARAENRCPRDCAPPQRDQNGCCVRVVLLPNTVHTNGGIHFASGSSSLLPTSFPTLNAIVTLLRDNTEVTVEVQVHTDSMGSESFNYRLSHQRAMVVREYLVGQGIAPLRVVAQGYGEWCPIAPNSTAEGRAANRRVEFFRTDPAGSQSPCRLPQNLPAPREQGDGRQYDPQQQYCGL